MQRLAHAFDALSAAKTPEDARSVFADTAPTLSPDEAALFASFAAQDGRLREANEELKSFSYAVSHDLRAPVRAVIGFATALEEDAGDALPGEAKEHLARVKAAAERMNEQMQALVALSDAARATLAIVSVDISEVAVSLLSALRRAEPLRNVRVVVDPGLLANGDERLVRAALAQILSNAWKFTSKKDHATITVGSTEEGLYVRDDGVGFDPAFAQKLFAPLQRLCGQAEYPGVGMGLALVSRIVRRHGGFVRAESALGAGTTLHFGFSQ